MAAPPASGTVIRNTAESTYIDSASGLSVRLTSNTVNTQVSLLEALTLTSSQSQFVAIGAPFVISHMLTNTGNSGPAGTNYTLTVAPVAGGGFSPINLQLVRDLNANGRPDLGEPVVAPGSSINLASGANAALLVVGQVPLGALAGSSGQLTVLAISTVQGATATNTDRLTVTSGAAVQATLAASTASAVPAAPFNLTATAVNNGLLPAGPTAVTVNGVAANLFVLRVPVPVNTRFVPAQPAVNLGAQTLYHLSGTPAGRYVTVVPAGEAVDAVAWSLPNLPSGSSLQAQFTVMPNANAAGTLSATAYMDWNEASANFTTPSNTVLLALPGRAPTIGFYPPSGYTKPVAQSMPGAPLFVQVDAAMCNVDPAQSGTLPVTLVSQLTGDAETFTATETGPNTGIYRIQPHVPTANAATVVAASGNGVVEILRNDIISARITDCGSVSVTAMTTLLIDPSGVVYDSRTGVPVAGVTVQLIDINGVGNGGNAGGAAVVLAAAGVTPAPSSIVTTADGSFAFPLVVPGAYRLQITTPAGYNFASVLPPALQPSGRIIDPQGSYGQAFMGGGASLLPVYFDVPVDSATPVGALFIEKTTNKAVAEIGDFVDYAIRFNNASAVAYPDVVLTDLLPAGFAYMAGSARLNGAFWPDPTGRAGPSLQFAMGSIAPGSQPKLTYRVRLGVGADAGTGVNSAQAGNSSVRSNNASVRVKVIGGVFSDKAYLIGKVFTDCSRNGVQDAGEAGVPGVRIYLENGTYAITDEEGKYSFYGLEPRTHVAKVDGTTLPAGVALRVLGNRNALDASSRFVDVINGELGRADFAVGECSAALGEEIAARRRALVNPAEIVQAVANPLNGDRAGLAVDARTLPASGALGLPGALRAGAGATISGPNTAGLAVAGGNAGVPANAPFGTALGAVGDPGGPYAPRAQGLPRPAFTPGSRLSDVVPALTQPANTAPPVAVAPAALPALEDLLPDMTSEPGFVGLQQDQVLAAAQTRVRVKGPLGARFELSVNGQAVPESQVGQKSSLEKNAVAGWEFVGVNLQPGRNTLALRVLDGFGVSRGQAEVTVLAPGALAKIEIAAPAEPVADASTPLAVIVRLRDANGLPVAARTQVTLQASLGQWQTEDLDARQNGVQVFVEGGEGRFLLLPPAQPGKAEIAGLANGVRGVVSIDFVPNLRPMIAAGIVEGTFNFRSLGADALRPTQSGDVFERQIQSASYSFNGGKGAAAARTALFLKGKVLGSSLLTLSYDSDKPADTALFRDIQPNQFYPVYGDSGTRGFDAQSTGKLYVLLQNGSNYALIGDFTTQSDNPARQLSQYSRALNGVKGRWQQGAVSAEGFSARTSSTLLVEEFRANGTSGPFRLDLNGVVNSQQVEVITRSRNQPSVVLADTALTPFTDYEIEYYTGLLLLKSPVSSVDPDLNPVFIRVTYSVDNGGPKHSVNGAEGRVDIFPGVSVGASVMRDEDPTNQQTMTGLNFSARLGEKTVATGEVARSTTDLKGSGNGQRLDLRHDGTAWQARAWGAQTDAGFYNIGSPQGAGQAEYGAKLAVPLNPTNRLIGEALRTSNSVSGAEQTGAELKIEHSLPGNVKLEGGVRYSSANAYALLSAPAFPGSLSAGSTQPVVPAASLAADPANAEQAGYTSARVKLTVPVPEMPQAEIFGVAEYAIDGSGGRELGAGFNYAINPTTKLYARHNFVNSLNGPYTLSRAVQQYSTVAGLTTELSDSTQLFNEYRVGDSLDGRGSEAAVGLKRQTRLASGIGLSATLQRIKPMSGVVVEDSTAVALGADYVGAIGWKASSQAQWQSSTTTESWLLTAAVASKLDESWTLLNRGLYSLQTNKTGSGGERELVTAQSGLAFRPVATNVWNALARIEYKRDRDSTLGASMNRDEASWVASTHLNLQPARDWLVTGRYAARLASDRANSLDSRSVTQLIGGRSTWDLTRDWDLGVQGYRTWGNSAAENAYGAEVGYRAFKNLWASLGYNVKGFKAPDLSGDAYTRHGVYFRLRFKFDENLFGPSSAMPSASSAPVGAP
ncbi:MAG: DUF11 domain-containing protein [Polaromonas sp.]|nr:DUF11 domain-containing protein [Polaromonas sp.]